MTGNVLRDKSDYNYPAALYISLSTILISPSMSSSSTGDNAFTAFTSIDTTRKTFGSDGAARWQTWNKLDESKVGKASTNQPLHVAPRKKGDAMLGQLSGSLTWEEEKRISEQVRLSSYKDSPLVSVVSNTSP